MVLPRSQLEGLQDLSDDDLRVAAVQELGGSLVGRPLSTGVVQLLEAILKHRHGMGLADSGQQDMQGAAAAGDLSADADVKADAQ